jgi:hypothetical protein
MLVDLGENNSILSQFIAEIRDESTQRDRLRFRRNLERIGEIFAYEISKHLNYKETEVQTPLGIACMNIPDNSPVLATIMRAGLPFQQGFLNYFDNAGNAFISAYRKYHQDGTFDIKFEHLSSPDLKAINPDTDRSHACLRIINSTGLQGPVVKGYPFPYTYSFDNCQQGGNILPQEAPAFQEDHRLGGRDR